VWLEPSDDAIVMAAAGEIGAHGNPHVRNPGRCLDVGREAESRRHHSDDQMASTVNENRLADEAGVGNEMALPQSVTKDGDVAVSLFALFGQEGATQHRIGTQYREQLGR